MIGKLETKNYEWVLLKPKGKKMVMLIPEDSKVTTTDVCLLPNVDFIERKQGCVVLTFK